MMHVFSSGGGAGARIGSSETVGVFFPPFSLQLAKEGYIPLRLLIFLLVRALSFLILLLVALFILVSLIHL